MLVMMNGAHMAPATGIKPSSPVSNTTTPNANQSMMATQNPQAMPQSQFAAFASSFVDRNNTFDPSKMYAKNGVNQSPAFWNQNPFTVPFSVNNGEGDFSQLCKTYSIQFRFDPTRRQCGGIEQEHAFESMQYSGQHQRTNLTDAKRFSKCIQVSCLRSV
jgi:hypothetical protein